MALSPELTAITFGLLSAISFGAGDFGGGLASRRANVIGVVVISHGSGLLMLLAVALLSQEVMPPVSDLLLGGAAGIAGAAGLAALYRALASGHMGIAAPVSAVLTAALPVVFSLFMRGLPEPVQIMGFVLAFASISLISYVGGISGRRQGIGLALLAGTGFGIFYILLNQIESNAVLWPLVAARCASTTVMLMAALASRRAWMPPDRRVVSIILLSSVLDAGGNVFFLIATQAGRLDIAAVVSSLYPVATIILARFVLNERLTRTQTIGVMAALVAVALISA